MLKVKKSRYLLMVLLIAGGCLDKYNFDVSQSESLLVVDGMITNEPGPYTVKLFRSGDIGDYSNALKPVKRATIILKDDQGNAEQLQETAAGIYQTSTNGIQGQYGFSYHIDITTLDGESYYSSPEVLKPAGRIDSVYYNFEFKESISNGEVISNNGFNILIDATFANGPPLVRWKWNGTYRIFAHPELVTSINTGTPGLPYHLATPLPCSGYTSTDFINLQKVDICRCCDCWINENQKIPLVSDSRVITSKSAKGIKLDFISVNARRFYEKYYVQLQQLSLSEKAYEFWNQVAIQMQAGSSLFQPTMGKIPGNIISNSKDKRALGIFSACGSLRADLWIKRTDIPYAITDEVFTDSCLSADSSATNVIPDFWK